MEFSKHRKETVFVPQWIRPRKKIIKRNQSSGPSVGFGSFASKLALLAKNFMFSLILYFSSKTIAVMLLDMGKMLREECVLEE